MARIPMVDERDGHGDSVMTVHAASLRLSDVIELSMRMARERDAERLLGLFCEGIHNIVSANCVTVGMLDVDGNVNHIVSKGYEAAQSENVQLQLKAFLSSLIEEQRQGELTEAQLHERAADVPFRITAAGSFLSMPIASDRRTFGWLYASEKSDCEALSSEDERLIAMLAAQLTVAYENLLLLQEIERAGEVLRKAEAKYRTSWRHSEQQLRLSHKMADDRRLTGAIAHDFNDLLTVILGYANMMLEEQPHDSRFHQFSAEVKKAGERAAELTRQLVAFGKSSVVRPVILDLNAVISTIQSMLCQLMGEDIEFEVLAGNDLKPIKVDLDQIEQVLLNLLINAKEAMPRGGKLVIETANDSGWVKLEVRDSGCGMPPEVLSRVFEPFFTTKESGTGLGLSAVYGVVYQNGGEIEIDSEVGLGTTVRLYFPQAKSRDSAS
jgi:signal transduction histidine kinase